MPLENLPLENIPGPEFFFDHNYYRRVLFQTMEKFWAGRSLALASGATSLDKSIFSQRLKEATPNTKIIWLITPPKNGDDLLVIICGEIRVDPEAPDRVSVLRDIKERLLELHDEGSRYLVIMDHVNDMADDVLECVRLLNNLENSSMYTNHFSLESLPFENVPDPAYFFDQGDYSRVLSRMKDSLRAGRGLMVVAGPIGTGKTTLSQKLMVSVPQQTRIIWLGEPPETSDDLLLFISHELNIKSELPGRVFVLRDIKEFLQKLHSEGNRCLLIIDEVHKVSDDVLECVRLLNNLEQGSLKLIQILLIGQEEFLTKLARPELESFKQRIAWLEAIGKMTPNQTQEYIKHRINVAGGQADLFSDDAIEAVVVSTRGTPRLINTLCDRSLRVSYEGNKLVVDLDSVRKAADDIGLGSDVFLWLMKREEKMEKMAKAAQEAENLEEDGLANDEPNDDFGQDEDPRHRLQEKLAMIGNKATSLKEWRELLNDTFTAYPFIQLFVSMLMFAASVAFYIVHTGT